MYIFLFFAVLIILVTVYSFTWQIPTSYTTVTTVYDDFDDDDDIIIEETIIIED